MFRTASRKFERARFASSLVVAESEKFLEASISTLGKCERCCEKYASAKPAISSSKKKSTGSLNIKK